MRNEPTDAEIIGDVLRGDRQRFQAIVERYQGPLLRLAQSRLGRHDWAEDAVQDAFLWAFKSLATYDSRFSFRTWLWTILLNQCHRQHQKRLRRTELEATAGERSATDQPRGSAEPLAADDQTPPQSLLAKERTQVLAEVLADLPAEQADALRLRFYGGLKFQEIADVQGCSLTSAKNRVRWGLLKMSARLGSGAYAEVCGAHDD